ncbi:MAG: DNA polymerase family A protein [Caulobacteraceae bacterium]
MTHATLDFETYSAAGFRWDPAVNKWKAPEGSRSKGLSAVGASVYTEHPSAEVLTMSYQLPGGPMQRWRPGEPHPTTLFAYLAAGGTVESHNAMFERLVWTNICVPRYGFPPLNPYQQRCSMATARIQGLPGALANLSDVLRLPVPKDAEGGRLLKKFSIPRDPTKKDARTRIMPEDEPDEFERLRSYCDTDVIAEHGASERMVPMSTDELLFWWIDQEINWRGVAVDREAIRNCMVILEQALEQYGAEFRTITTLDSTQLQAVKGWLAGRGVYMDTMDEDAIDAALLRPMPEDARRVLEIRQLIGSASVKKLYAMDLQASGDDRLRNLIVHHGARTGRPTGEGPQPLNLPRAGPSVSWCACGKPSKPEAPMCPWCGSCEPRRKAKWSAAAVDPVLEIMATRDLSLVEWFFGDALLCISGCIRGLFVAGPGMELICSDYSAIEAVVIAQLAGEQWRIDAFHAKIDIYLASASRITGTPVEVYLAYYAEHGEHHPDRQAIGKVAELGLGFGGWLGAWRIFDDTPTFTDEQVKRNILAWRDASPAVVEMWGGQYRRAPNGGQPVKEFYGVEGAAIQAIMSPTWVFEFRGIAFFMRNGALIIRLPSGRELTYQQAQVVPSDRWLCDWSIVYMTWNSNPKYGPMGWGPMATFGGRLTENIVQAVAHDLLRFAIIGLRAAGYPCVLHIYDEILCEIPEGSGSIEQFEALMSATPDWARGWPVRASGGWRGKRYRKG